MKLLKKTMCLILVQVLMLALLSIPSSLAEGAAPALSLDQATPQIPQIETPQALPFGEATGENGMTAGANEDSTELIDGDFTYWLTDGEVKTATVKKYNGTAAQVTVPSTLGGYTVTAIGSNAFYRNATLTSVTLPSGIADIGANAFYSCTLLSSVTFPDTLKTIGSWAFSQTVIAQAALPDTVESIGDYAFRACSNLTQFDYPKGLTTAGKFIFYNSEKLTSITVPEGVTALPAYVFDYSDGLTSLSLPSTLTSIGDYALTNCGALTKVSVPASVKSIGDYALYQCAALKEVSFAAQATLTKVGRFAFMGCTTLSALALPDTVTEIGYAAFMNDAALAAFHYPAALTSITPYSKNSTYYYGNVFYGCQSLKSVAVPDGVTVLPGYVFYNGNCIESITLPDSLEKIGYAAFYRCGVLAEVNYPKALKQGGDRAFFGCVQLKSITVPEGVTAIAPDAFSCGEFTEIVLPSTLQSVGSRAFFYCRSLQSLTLPKGVQTISPYAFYYCTGLATVNLSDGLTSVGESAFADSGLTALDLPDSVTEIGANAFSECAALKSLYAGYGVVKIGMDAFADCGTLTVYCPRSSYMAAYAAANGIAWEAARGGDTDGLRVLNAASSFAVSLSGLSVSGYATATLYWSIEPEVFSLLQEPCLTLHTVNADITADTFKMDGRMLTKTTATQTGDYTLTTLARKAEIAQDQYADYNENTYSVPISAAAGKLTFSFSKGDFSRVAQTAALQYSYQDAPFADLIGYVDEELDALTVETNTVTSTPDFTVRGRAPSGAAVALYVDGELQTTVTASEAGVYSASLTLNTPENLCSYTVNAEAAAASGLELSAKTRIMYRMNEPRLTRLTLYYMGAEHTIYDAENPDLTLPAVAVSPSYSLTFSAEFENADAIDMVLITSTRSGVKRSLKAKYNAASGAFVAAGLFDENDDTYVPGVIGVEYTLKYDGAAVAQTVDMTPFTFDGAQIEDYVKTDTNTFDATIDLSQAYGDGMRFKLHVQRKLIARNDDPLDAISAFGVSTQTAPVSVSDATGQIYKVFADASDDSAWRVAAYAPAAAASQRYVYLLSLAPAAQTGNALREIAQNLVNESLLVDEVFTTYGLYANYEALLADIEAAASVTDKLAAKEKAEKLYTDQLTFTLMMAALPKLKEMNVNVVPDVLLSAMLSAVAESGAYFRSLYLGGEKNGSFDVRWALEPSGYVYEAVTGNRLTGVLAAAYWVKYDSADPDFFETAPETGAGVLWDATPWNQVNPALTDLEGRYTFDVPKGWWQIRLTKDGYDAASGEWLSVETTQSEAGVGMVSHAAPILTAASVHAEGITLMFGKYVKPETLAAITVCDGTGETVACTVSYDKTQTSLSGECFANKCILAFDSITAASGDTFTVSIPATVQSYAGTAMTATEKTLTYTGEKKFTAPGSLSIPCAVSASDNYSFTVRLQNAAAGDLIKVSSDSDGIVSVKSVGALNADGEATVILHAGFAGQAALNLSLEGEDLQLTIPVTVNERTITGRNGLSITFGGAELTAQGSEIVCTLINSGAAEKVKLVAAVYDGAKMTDIRIVELSLARSAVSRQQLTLGPGTVHIMVWKSDTLEPLLDEILTLR